MSRPYLIDHSAQCVHITEYEEVLNYRYTTAIDRSQIMAWLPPQEPGLWHRDIKERRTKNVGEWLLQTEEFRGWYDPSGKGEGDNAVLFCYGDPGVGKTFIR